MLIAPLQVVLLASNWVVVKDCEATFDPYLFAVFRQVCCQRVPQLQVLLPAWLRSGCSQQILTKGDRSCVLLNMCMGCWACNRGCGAGRFTVAALAFSPFLKQAMASKRIWRGGVELGFWMALGECLACAWLFS